MKMKFRPIVLLCLLIGTLLALSGCSGKSVYESFDEDGFSVSIRFDANGGTMMNQVESIVDTFNIADMKPNADGKIEIALLNPADSRRGSVNVCKPSYPESGYYLAGWYSERTENPDGEGYIYANPWNFDTDRVSVDANGKYSASEPVITLYAVWKPLLTVEIIDRATNELMDTIQYDPTLDEIRMPEWKRDSTRGNISMNGIPGKDGYTFDCAYYDLEGTRLIDTPVLVHTAESDPDATAMKIYVDWLEGEWYHIYSAKQLSRSADCNGNYVIFDNLDFSKVEWPKEFMNEEFNGTIQTVNGEVFKLSNITFQQDNVEVTKSGLFLNINESASISDVTFDNVVFTLKKGTTKNDCAYGLFASNIADGATLTNVSITNSQMLISPEIAPNVHYNIGLICADGNWSAIDTSGITCTVMEGNPSWNFTVRVDGNTVIIEEN